MLKRLEIAGFKSFARKTVLDFSNSTTAVVGPNGSGKCVTGDTRVQLADGSVRPIKTLFDEAERTARAVTQYDDGVAITDSGADTEVLALDLETQQISARPVSAYVRRTAPEHLLKITTRSGRSITATPYHPLFGLEKGKVSAIRADALKAGIKIAAPRRLPVKTQMQPLSMFSFLAAFREEDAVYVPYSRTLAASLEAHAGTHSATRIAHTVGLDSEVVQRFQDTQALPVSAAIALFAGEDEAEIFPSRELKSRTWGFIRIPEAVDERVARFLGYLIAEGRNCKNGQIRFVNDDLPLVEDFVSCAYESFGVSTTLRSYKGRGIVDAFISSVTLSRLLERVFGITQDGHSRTKTVPSQIYASPDSVVSAFLAALFEGDGHLHIPTPRSRTSYFEYATASEELAHGVADLLLRFGISAVIRKKMKWATNSRIRVKRPYWSVFVYGSAQLQSLSGAVSFKGRKALSLASFSTSEKASNPNIDLIPGAALLVHEAARASGISIKKLRKEYPTLAAYYEGRCEASRPGILRCIEAILKYGVLSTDVNARITELRTLVEADILWDEIVSVEEETGHEFVYDLCVEKDHNFIANSIVAHNSNIAEAFRFALGEQSMKSMRGKRSEDLIFAGSHAAPRANRAAVAIVFDNTQRQFKVDFEEVVIERAVFRDGTSEYSLNGSRVRLRDIEELLAGANIGETGHHIISQGEADRILVANPRERREMLEDALGLKIYEFKKQEAERKLTKTEDNIAQVNSLRRELAPHLRFLEKQVERLERAEELRRELVAAAQTYFAIEDLYLAEEKKKTADALVDARARLSEASATLIQLEEMATTDAEGGKRLEAVRRAEQELERSTNERAGLAREIGRIEGALAAAKRRSAETAREPYVKIPRNDLGALRDEIAKQGEEIGRDSIDALRSALSSVVRAAHLFFERFAAPQDDTLADEERTVYGLENEKNALLEKDAAFGEAVEKARSALARAREALVAHDETGKELRHRVLELAQTKAHGEGETARYEARLSELALRAEELDREKGEALAIGGTAAISYEPLAALPPEERKVQEDRRRAVDRLKIRLEEAGGTGEDIRAEHKEVAEREAFLARELEDLAKSAAGLRELVGELDTELGKSFAEGLSKVNASFGEFFMLMFGGGGARLALEESEDDEETENEEDDMPKEPQRPGIEISVHLPKKKVQSLVQLSGGERALTSIALIFAMSQVNPPPFLILDETDAALDEANSRRYGDMIENLARKSQLIVITHNRETMSRAGILYGVTMGGDGVSKLLSVKFDEALAVAK